MFRSALVILSFMYPILSLLVYYASAALSLSCTGANIRPCASAYAQAVNQPQVLLKAQYLEDSLDACKLVGAVPRFACSYLTAVAEKAFARALEFAFTCEDGNSCNAAGITRVVTEVTSELDQLWHRYRETPMGTYLARAYNQYVNLMKMYNPDMSIVDFMHKLSLEICDQVRVFVYSTQRLNIMLHAFEKFPTPANNTLPDFRFSHLLGARWEVALELLAERVDQSPRPVVAEIGVFRGSFSEFILENHSGLTLIGVDPYFGQDGTFPPPEKAEDEVDPEIIYSLAKSKYDRFPGRANLLRMTSGEAANLVPDESLDLVFIDGCHEIPCVAEDLEFWVRKVKAGGVVMGHDYSERWPGVMLVLNDYRKGRDLFLGSDLVWWFYKD